MGEYDARKHQSFDKSYGSLRDLYSDSVSSISLPLNHSPDFLPQLLPIPIQKDEQIAKRETLADQRRVHEREFGAFMADGRRELIPI